MERSWIGYSVGFTSRRDGVAVRVGLLLTALLALVVGQANAVSVTPSALYLDSRNRTGTLTLYNPGSLPEEIQIGFAFGYPRSDSLGNVSVQLMAEAPAGEPSAVEWLQAFPRRLVLQPGQRQVVRVLAQPPAELSDGEYWARIVISSRGGQPPIEQVQNNLRLQLHVETVLVTAANFRKGEVETGLEILAAGAVREDSAVAVWLTLQRTGNAAFLGRARLTLLSASGEVLSTGYDDLAVYRSIQRRLTLPVPANAAGPLRVRVAVTTEREDLPPGGALPAPPLTREFAVAP